MAILCPDEYAEWKSLYDEWSECHDGVGELRETALQTDAEMFVVCAGAAATVETIVGGIIGGAACALLAWKLADAIDDLNDGIAGCNKKAAASDAQGRSFNKCVSDHKKDP